MDSITGTRVFHHRGHVIEVTDTGNREWRATIDGDEVNGVWKASWDAFLDVRRKVDRKVRAEQRKAAL